MAPNPVPALAKEWERNTVDPWRTETDPGVSMKRGTSLAGHGLKTEKRSRKQKLALLQKKSSDSSLTDEDSVSLFKST